MVLKGSSLPNNIIVDLKSFCSMVLYTICTHCTTFKVVYTCLLWTCMQIKWKPWRWLYLNYTEHGIGKSIHYIALVGDKKTFTRIHELKHAYGSELDWLIPFIGDWHLLSNHHCSHEGVLRCRPQRISYIASDIDRSSSFSSLNIVQQHIPVQCFPYMKQKVMGSLETRAPAY